MPEWSTHILSVCIACAAAVGGLTQPGSGQCQDTEHVQIPPASHGVAYQYGRAVAVDGNVIVIGEANNNPGTADVYRYEAGAWMLEDVLGTAANDSFGFALAMSGDVIVAGAPGDSSIVSANGAAFVFRYNGGTWQQEDVLTITDPVAIDRIGWAVAIDGDVVVVGGKGPSNGAGLYTGRAAVFRFDGLDWVQESELVASQPEDIDAFGLSVDVSGDIVVVGARHASPSFVGAAYVYRFDGVGWVEEQRLTVPGGIFNHFGASVAIRGSTIVVGAPEIGNARVFEHDGNAWVLAQTLAPLHGRGADEAGVSVAIDDDVIVVGANWDDDAVVDGGAAYVYLYTGGSWVEAAQLIASDAAFEDQFGESVAVGSGFAVVGARLHDVQTQNTGSVYVFAGIADCDGTGELDLCEILAGTTDDIDGNGNPDTCDCPWDLDADGEIGIVDFLDLLAQWGTDPGGPPDFDGDGTVGITDFLELLANWGTCP